MRPLSRWVTPVHLHSSRRVTKLSEKIPAVCPQLQQHLLVVSTFNGVTPTQATTGKMRNSLLRQVPKQSCVFSVSCEEIQILGKLRGTAIQSISQSRNRRALRNLNLVILGLTDSSSNRQQDKPMCSTHQITVGPQDTRRQGHAKHGALTSS